MQAVTKLSSNVFNKSFAAVKWPMLLAWICLQELWFLLKSEQRKALELLLRGKDVFCVLPTGFHKSPIYQMFVHVKSSSSSVQRPTVISPGWKRGISRKHMTFTSCKNAACSNELFSLSSRLRFGGKTFWLSKCEFCPLIKYISYWEVVTRILIFSGRHDFSDARAFSFLALYKCKASRNQSPSVSNSQRGRSCEQIFDSSTTFLNPLVGTNSLIIWKTDSRFFFARLWGSRASRA